MVNNNEVFNAANSIKNNLAVTALLESLSEAVIIINDSGNVVLINNRMEELFGYNADEVIGKPLDVFLPASFQKRHEEHILNYFEKPHKRPMGKGLELYGRRKDGTEFPVDVSLSAFHSETHKLAIAFVMDITARIQAQDELRQQNEDLDAFAHTVAHDLNSIINSIVGFSQLLVEDNSYSKEERSEILSHIFKSSHKMSTIIKELLIFANIRKTEVELSPIDTSKIIEEVIIRLGFQLNENNAKIIIPKKFHTALGYSAWVEEIWYNLISNAIKYGGTPPVIELGSEVAGDSILFWIKDNGAGLSDEGKKIIFTSPEKLHQQNSKGFGLGLSIVKRILDKINGSITLESGANTGSKFIFSLKKK
ncbi:MAG: hypothetical protein CVV23_00265 [Ignavibacteriae bacterium HGW-Ignavibacteriae-2]|nr:MAG: hypothetical protein CVV23_00265 [Ignavibacteriae bacterium HGW-Ignavibacteriae-2]